MKKLFFTAIALVAFSGISMASTTEVDVYVENPCKSTFTSAFNQALASGQDADSAWAYASFNYNMCVAGVNWLFF
jgi:hypothetical protein